MARWKRDLDDMSQDMPLDVMPISNGEFIPLPPTREERAIMELQEAEGERIRRRLGMSRRDFVRSAAALAVGFWAVDQVMGRGIANADHTTGADCVLDYPNAQLNNLPGEFIFDIQTHHVDEDGLWKVSNPGFHAFFALVWPQSGCGDMDRMDCLGRFHYAKEVYVDSSTTMGVLSAVPSTPERNPLPWETAEETVSWLNEMAGSERGVLHRFVMPNRGHAWATELASQPGLFLEQELADMTAAAQNPSLRAWKCYTPWGDVPNASGWWHDSFTGRAMIEHAIDIGVPLIATHKGFALPSFDQSKAACRDIGVVARDYPECSFIVYHSGFNGGLTYPSETLGPYPTNPDGTPNDAAFSSSDRGTNSLIKALRENGISARHYAPGGSVYTPGVAGDGDPEVHANCPNVYAEIGSTWRDNMNNPTRSAHLIGKLIYFVGPKRVVWGTDSLWYGSPQPVITAFRNFADVFSEAAPTAMAVQQYEILRDNYRLPWGIDGDVDDPSQPTRAVWSQRNNPHIRGPEHSIRNGIFGRNAAAPYKVDPDAAQSEIDCDALYATVQEDEVVAHRGTLRETRTMASNVVYGARDPKQLFDSVYPNAPWAP
jgi:uncharacterized protein